MTYYHFSAPFWDVPRQSNKTTELSVMSSIGERVLAVDVSSSKVDFTYLWRAQLASCAAWGHWLTELMVLPQKFTVLREDSYENLFPCLIRCCLISGAVI